MKPNEEETLDHAAPHQLTRLLSLATEQSKASGSLPATVGTLRSVRGLLENLDWPGGGTAADALTRAADPGATLEELKSLKQATKQLLAETQHEDSRNALTLLYHVAIAGAYAGHGENLSTRPLDSRSGLYEDLSTLFAEESVGAVFERCLERLWAGGATSESASG